MDAACPRASAGAAARAGQENGRGAAVKPSPSRGSAAAVGSSPASQARGGVAAQVEDVGVPVGASSGSARASTTALDHIKARHQATPTKGAGSAPAAGAGAAAAVGAGSSAARAAAAAPGAVGPVAENASVMDQLSAALAMRRQQLKE